MLLLSKKHFSAVLRKFKNVENEKRNYAAFFLIEMLSRFLSSL